MLVLTPILVPLATALVCAWLPVHRQRAIAVLGSLVHVVTALLLLSEVEAHDVLRLELGGWPPPFGVEIVIDRLGATLTLLAAVMGAATFVYSLSDADPGPRVQTRIPLVFSLLAGVGGAFSTGDLFNLYVWFELGLVGALGLLALSGTPRSLEATFKYFVLNVLGTLLFLIGIAYIYGATGQLGFGALREAALQPTGGAWAPFVGVLVLAALVKAGAFPVFSWLPAAYHTLPAPIVGLFAALLTKVGVYTVLRLVGDVFPSAPALIDTPLAAVAMITMIIGVLGAAHHWDIRRILAFHSASQVGYMLLGIALGTASGYAGTLVYVVHHGLVKANLFLIAGMVHRYTGSYDLRRCGGLFAARPWLATIFGLSAMSLVGLPPSSGFWAKFGLVRETIVLGRFAWTAVALGVGVLTLYSMLKIWFEAFWKPAPDDPISEGSATPAPTRLGPAYLVTGALALVSLALGLWPEPLLDWANRAFEGLPR
jgi:multicomponent Na+:H+ antiporter subunit D